MTESRRIGRFGATLTRYVARELVFPTALSLVGLTVLILTKDLLSFSDLVINRGFGAGAIALIAFYEIVPLIAQTLPFAVLIGALAGLGRLRADLEIVALEAAGVSSRRLIRPVLMFAAAMTIAGLLLALVAAPWATRSLETSLQQMVLANPGVVLRAGTVYEFGDVKVAAREVSARGDQLRGVLLWIPRLGQTMFAEQGALEPL
ncbi:MAG: LptF/LptG family permease, partial [Candidatus Binatia bacterium]